MVTTNETYANDRGAFDNEHLVLPRTNYDVEIDNNSPRPGQQAFEKMTAGYYLGEVFRLVLLDLHSQGQLFEGKDLSELMEPYALDTSVLAEIESDPFENLVETGDMFLQRFKLETTEPELRLIRRLAELIGERAARLSACGVAAIVKKKNIQVLSPNTIPLFCFFRCRVCLVLILCFFKFPN
jgi:hexokinase